MVLGAVEGVGCDAVGGPNLGGGRGVELGLGGDFGGLERLGRGKAIVGKLVTKKPILE